MSDCLNAAEIVFERNVLIGRVSVFVGQTKTKQNARHFESVVHLCDERNGAAFAYENRLPAEAFLQSGLSFFEDGIGIRSDPGFPRAQNFKFAVDRFRQELSNVLLDELGNLVRILMGDQASGEFCVRL